MNRAFLCLLLTLGVVACDKGGETSDSGDATTGEFIYELATGEDDAGNPKIDFKTMIVLAIATSIDALAVGVTFAFLKVNIILAVLLIGIITFIISMVGVKIGNVFGDKYEKKAEFAGGLILILLGLKILLEHLGILVL